MAGYLLLSFYLLYLQEVELWDKEQTEKQQIL